MGINQFDNNLPIDIAATNSNGNLNNYAPFTAPVQGIIYPNGPFPSAGPGRLDNNVAMYSGGMDDTLSSLSNANPGTSIQGPGPMMAAQPASHGQSIGMERGVSGGMGSQSFGGMAMADQGIMDDSYWNALIDGECL